MQRIAVAGEERVGGLSKLSGVDAELRRKRLERAIGPGHLVHQELEISERDRVEQNAHMAVAPHCFRQCIDDLTALLRVERIEVERHELHSGCANLVELRIDPLQRTAAIAVNDAQVHPVAGKLLGGREAKATRSPQHQRPLVRFEGAHVIRPSVGGNGSLCVAHSSPRHHAGSSPRRRAGSSEVMPTSESSRASSSRLTTSTRQPLGSASSRRRK